MRRSKWLLAAALAALLLAGCSLARPEEQGAQRDRWIGFYVVPSQGYVDHLADNPHVEEYGVFSAETDKFGTLTFPQEALFAVEDEAGNYIFPGIDKGYSLFICRRYDLDAPGYRGLNYSVGIVSNMGPGEEGPQFSYTDEGVSETASGVIYCGPPLGASADWDSYTNGNTIWRYYDVYQTGDGRIYINGDGDSVNGLMSKTQTATNTRTENGESFTETVQISVSMQAAQRLEKLVVTQFDENNAILRADDLNLESDRPELRCLPETAWVLVEEVSAKGTERTVYEPPEGEEPVSHEYVLLDGEGLGSMGYLNIYK